MHFTIEQLTDLVVNAIPTVAFLTFLSAFIFGGGLGEIIDMVVTGWLFG